MFPRIWHAVPSSMLVPYLKSSQHRSLEDRLSRHLTERLFLFNWLLVGRLSVIWQRYDGIMKWKHFPRYWPFVRGIHQSPVNIPHKGQWRGALIFSLICAWINAWVNNREAGYLGRHRAHYDMFAMKNQNLPSCMFAAGIITTVKALFFLNDGFSNTFGQHIVNTYPINQGVKSW